MRINWRHSISPITAVAFAAVGVTGVLMFFHVGGHSLNGLHEWMGLAFVAAGAVHVLLNLRAFLSYLRQPIAIAASAVTLILAVGLLLLGSGDDDHRGPPKSKHIEMRAD